MNSSLHHLTGSTRRGLTLGEMLVVLLVFSMLAIIFFFSSNLAITKTKLSSVAMDHKSLVQALATYEGEYYAIPTEAQGLEQVTHSPVSILSKVPVDPFTPSSNAQQYGYYSDLSAHYRWIVVSVGPDGVPDVDLALLQMRKNAGKAGSSAGQIGAGQAGSMPLGHTALMTDKDAQDFITKCSYDPTNGAFSKGDVITVYGQNR